MKEAFDETYVAEGLDPLDGALQDFDWNELYRRLAEDVSNGEVDKNLAEVITRLIQLLIPYRQGRIQPVSIGLNIIALAWGKHPMAPQPFLGLVSGGEDLSPGCSPPRRL